MTAREEILARVRAALADVPPDEEVPVPREYRRSHATGELVELFAERVADYRATAVRVPGADVAQAVAHALRARGARRVVVPDGFPPEWLPTGFDFLADEPHLDVRELDGADGVLSCAAVGIAVTGTLILDAGPGQGRRALTLVPDYHLCVIRADQIAGDVPEALARLDPARPLTLISGPSATSDIELNRVEGVHGPRTLEVVVAT